jgi:hypothetical protein
MGWLALQRNGALILLEELLSVTIESDDEVDSEYDAEADLQVPGVQYWAHQSARDLR